MMKRTWIDATAAGAAARLNSTMNIGARAIDGIELSVAASLLSPLAVAGMHGLGVNLQVLLPLPAHAALGVFQDDALLQQPVPDPVGEREVAGLLGRRALHNQRLNVAIG